MQPLKDATGDPRTWGPMYPPHFQVPAQRPQLGLSSNWWYGNTGHQDLGKKAPKAASHTWALASILLDWKSSYYISALGEEVHKGPDFKLNPLQMKQSSMSTILFKGTW